MNLMDQLGALPAGTQVLTGEPLSQHTTFRIGGPADYFVIPGDAGALAEGIRLCRQAGVPYYVIGNGSNLLVRDGGFRGVIFSICRTMDQVVCEPCEDGTLLVTAGAGVMLTRLARQVSDLGYTGFEYATGIPGTLGGAVTMNAGAYGGEIRDALTRATVLDPQGQILVLAKEDLDLSYRHSIIMEKDLIVLEAVFRFAKGDPAAIAARIDELTAARREKQPLEYPSAGSTFKRPEGYFAGKLIQDAGLKGFGVGDAQVSEKHSGFVINRGNATADQVLTLIGEVQARVMAAYGVMLEPEIRIIGSR